MAEVVIATPNRVAQYGGLRMTAEQYFALEDDGCKYELIDGVVVMSPSPTPRHQALAMEIAGQLFMYLRDHPVGRVLAETDVQLGKGPTGRDLVYRPEIVFIATERLSEMRNRLVGPPDMVVEVISPTSRRMDTETKKEDYERIGVHEYWLFDPERNAMTFYRLEGDRFVEATVSDDAYVSQAVPGFTLDLKRVRESFNLW